MNKIIEFLCISPNKIEYNLKLSFPENVCTVGKINEVLNN